MVGKTMDLVKEMLNMAIEENMLELDDEPFPIIGKEYLVLEYLFSEDYDGEYTCEDIYFDTVEEALSYADDFWLELKDYDKKFCDYCFVGRHRVIGKQNDKFQTTDWLEIVKTYKGNITV